MEYKQKIKDAVKISKTNNKWYVYVFNQTLNVTYNSYQVAKIYADRIKGKIEDLIHSGVEEIRVTVPMSDPPIKEHELKRIKEHIKVGNIANLETISKLLNMIEWQGLVIDHMARDNGYQDGYDVGYEKGYEKGCHNMDLMKMKGPPDEFRRK